MYVCSVSVNIIFRLVSLANIMNQKAKVKSFFGGSVTKLYVFAKSRKTRWFVHIKKRKPEKNILRFSSLVFYDFIKRYLELT